LPLFDVVAMIFAFCSESPALIAVNATQHWRTYWQWLTLQVMFAFSAMSRLLFLQVSIYLADFEW